MAVSESEQSFRKNNSTNIFVVIENPARFSEPVELPGLTVPWGERGFYSMSLDS